MRATLGIVGAITVVAATALVASFKLPIADAQSAGDPAGESAAAPAAFVQAATPEQAGAYIVGLAGCNDCHTPGWMETDGRIPVADWLTGSPVGFRGPWGTSYPANLRLTAQALTEDDWVEMARHRSALPPMPWMNLRAITEQDLRAVYRFVHSLGAAGEPTPAALPPGEEPATSYILMVPQSPAL